MISFDYPILEGKSFSVCIFGCQMNEHDGERVVGMLEACGAHKVSSVEESDITVFLTCCVREAADIRLLGRVASLKNTPAPHGKRIVAVGGCIGQRDGQDLINQLKHIDVVFGTHNLQQLPELLSQAYEANYKPQATLLEESEFFSSELPVTRDKPWHGWIAIMTGCNNFCTYCIVPYVRGREKSRVFEDIVTEAHSCVEQGVKEIYLLGQNVNSYGRDRYDSLRFAELLKAVGETGIERLRFATSHPKDLSDETIAAFAETPSVMPQLHLPVQSGSDRILKAMNRKYTADSYRTLIRKMREAVPEIAFSTDIIVGFPGETEEDFQQTYDLVKEVGFSQAFTFIYSKRAGTPAATMPDDTPREVIQERFDRLQELVQTSAYEQNLKEAGTTLPVLIEGVSKRDENMLSGRSPKNQTVHAPIPRGYSLQDFQGNIIPVTIEETKTWYLSGHVSSDKSGDY